MYREAVHKCCLCDESCDSFPKFTKHINSDKHRSLMTKWIQLDSTPEPTDIIDPATQEQYQKSSVKKSIQPHINQPPTGLFVYNQPSSGDSQYHWRNPSSQFPPRMRHPNHQNSFQTQQKPRMAWPPIPFRNVFRPNIKRFIHRSSDTESQDESAAPVISQSLPEVQSIQKRPHIGNHKERASKFKTPDAVSSTFKYMELDAMERSVTENESIPVIKEPAPTPQADMSTPSLLPKPQKQSHVHFSTLQQDSSDEDIPLAKIIEMKKNSCTTDTNIPGSSPSDCGLSFSGAGSIFCDKPPKTMFEKLKASCSQKENTTTGKLASPLKMVQQNSSESSPSEDDLPPIFSSPPKSKKQIADRTEEILRASLAQKELEPNHESSNDENNMLEGSIDKEEAPNCIQQQPANNSDAVVPIAQNIQSSFTQEIENTQSETNFEHPIETTETQKEQHNKVKTRRKRENKKEQQQQVTPENKPKTKSKKAKSEPKAKSKKAGTTKKSPNKKSPSKKLLSKKSTLKAAKSMTSSPTNDSTRDASISTMDEEDPERTTLSSLDDTNELLDRLEQEDSSLETLNSSKPSGPSSEKVKSLIKKVSVKVNIHSYCR